VNFFKSPSPKQVVQHFDRSFHALRDKQPEKPLQVRVFAPKQGLDYSFPAASANRRFHVASVGKLFTAVLVQRLATRGMLTLSDPIAHYLSPEVLRGLFVFQQHDYTQQVTVEQLLAHTAGIADYFEGKTASGRTFIQDVLAKPDTRWNPLTLLEFTRAQQQAIGAPGRVFNYSDSGYILLGLLVEAVSGKTFAQNLEDEIFAPLEMRDSSLMFYPREAGGGESAIEQIFFNGVEISRFESLSCDWAGGGILSTTADLLKFSLALRGGRLVEAGRLEGMDVCNRRFRPGIYYGQGMMEIRFGEFFFLLGGLPKVKGHIGILATHLFYDLRRDAHIVMNFGDNTRTEESFKALIEIEMALQRLG